MIMQKIEAMYIKNCRECPYVGERVVEKTSECHGFAEISDRVEDWNPEKLFCEKIGGIPCLDGECQDAYQKVSEVRRYSRKKRLNAWRRKRKYKRHLKEIAIMGELRRENCKNCMYSGAVYMDENANGDLLEKPYYRRYWRGSRFKEWRDISNRKVRRYKGDIHNGGFYKKIFDYWWTVD